MASNLSACPDCGHTVSRSAYACPGCGAELRLTIDGCLGRLVRGAVKAFVVLLVLGAVGHILIWVLLRVTGP